ncbi:hypothetical protein EYZ11_009669 [Aspergillus tanneri]|uniref:Uncharacterized protein n=1 Tax=Aspergillus tanneri TaxID=1220188 RepID=A0A4S3JCP9_9EURO|nr:hypothetical protein EYZ11_009669 [Aspergillus tanneri]
MAIHIFDPEMLRRPTQEDISNKGYYSPDHRESEESGDSYSQSAGRTKELSHKLKDRYLDKYFVDIPAVAPTNVTRLRVPSGRLPI